MILLENVAYLVDDAKRQAVFNALRDQVGISPVDILSAPPEILLGIVKAGGMNAEGRVAKLRTIAEIALQEFSGELQPILRLPLAQAKKALKRFPGIGHPGAEKILLFSGSHPLLALESNGLRVLVRIGFGTEQSYASTYRSAQEAATNQLERDCAWVIRAHQLLRRHGQELCRRSKPACRSCPLKGVCSYYAGHTGP